ncbi:MAG TPA: trehalose-6-phosphate synthase [Gaiellaceae bacterium]
MEAPRRRLIVVSNRGPVGYRLDADGTRSARRGGGGLVTALGPLVSHHDVTWIASAITEEDHAVAGEAGDSAFEETGRDGRPYRLRLVRHDPADYDRYYNVLANPVLWFLQHYLWDLARAPSLGPELHQAWAGYAAVNEGFAAAVLEELDNEPATVWFHDYHLYLAPGLVRRERPYATLSHFVHIPWPSHDYWTVLPDAMRRAVHEGLLANDIVGFHTRRWREGFLASAEAVLGAAVDREEGIVEHDGRRTLVTAHPISVDTAEFDELVSSPAVLDAARDLEPHCAERVILRVDRTDPSKNIVRGFRAFALYLEQHPEACGHVGMLALLDPSRQDIPQYAAYLDEIHAAAREVNARFAETGWEPIRLEVRDDFARSVAAYKRYDVLLVNAVFDGLNLVAKEAPLVNERDGVLVLSENTGAHEELGEWALTVNPFDVAGQAEAIHQALELGADERRVRAEAVRAHVRGHDLAAWLVEQLADLDRVSPAPSYHRSS